MTTCDFAAVGWAITLIGLVITHYLANIRDTRKEVLSGVESLNKSIKLLGDMANNYYFPASSGTDKDRIALDIKIQFNEVERRIDWLKNLKKSKDFSDELYELFDMITGGNFESSSHMPGKQHSDKCHVIGAKIQNIIRNIDKWYEEKYQ